MRLHVHVGTGVLDGRVKDVTTEADILKYYSKAQIKREIEGIESRLKYNAIGLERARGARRYSYQEEKVELEKELVLFKGALSKVDDARKPKGDESLRWSEQDVIEYAEQYTEPEVRQEIAQAKTQIEESNWRRVLTRLGY